MTRMSYSKFLAASVAALSLLYAVSCEEEKKNPLDELLTKVDVTGGPTANCYIVPPLSDFTFDARYKGNSTEPVGKAAGAVLLWQDAKSLVMSIDYDAKKGRVRVRTSGVSGNAVVAVVSKDNTVLWSWHLWVTDYKPEASLFTSPANAAGTTWTFMDRNLGALGTAHEGTVSHGNFYQWGRKDPFPKAATEVEQNADYTYINDGEPEVYDIDNKVLPTTYALAEGNGSVEKSVANPRVFYKVLSVNTGEFDEYGEEIKVNVPESKDWADTSDDDRWGGVSMKKSLYDPCPAGYKVPVCDAEGNSPYGWMAYAGMTWDKENGGAEDHGQWFPGECTRVNYSGGLDYGSNRYSGMWTGTARQLATSANPEKYSYYSFVISGKRNYARFMSDSRSQGLSLRCVTE